MATTTAQTLDLAQVLVDALDGIADLRCYAYVPDTARVPCVIVMQPSVDYRDAASGFCKATWTFPLTIAVARNNDRDAQRELSRLLQEITSALDVATAPGVLSIDPVDALPTTATVSGAEQPGYALTVRIRA